MGRGAFISLFLELCWRQTPKYSYMAYTGHIFFLQEVRKVKSQFPLPSLWIEATAYFCWAALWNVYAFLGKRLSFSSLNNLWHFWKARAAALHSDQLKKPEIHTHLWMEFFQLTVLNESRRGSSNPKFGFVRFSIVWEAVAASFQIEPE